MSGLIRGLIDLVYSPIPACNIGAPQPGENITGDERCKIALLHLEKFLEERSPFNTIPKIQDSPSYQIMEKWIKSIVLNYNKTFSFSWVASCNKVYSHNGWDRDRKYPPGPAVADIGFDALAIWNAFREFLHERSDKRFPKENDDFITICEPFATNLPGIYGMNRIQKSVRYDLFHDLTAENLFPYEPWMDWSVIRH